MRNEWLCPDCCIVCQTLHECTHPTFTKHPRSALRFSLVQFPLLLLSLMCLKSDPSLKRFYRHPLNCQDVHDAAKAGNWFHLWTTLSQGTEWPSNFPFRYAFPVGLPLPYPLAWLLSFNGSTRGRSNQAKKEM